jgi:hypothetical protein
LPLRAAVRYKQVVIAGHRLVNDRRIIAGSAVVLFLAIGSTAASSGVATPNLSETPTLSPADRSFVLGNVGFALLHEFGHVVIRTFDIPLLGLEENSADTLAAVSLILLDRERPEAGFGEVLGVTALAQEFVWESGLEREQSEVILWAQHDLSARRFARLVCLIYGSNPARFAWVAKAADMQENRAEGCSDEWRIAERATHWVRETYGISSNKRASQRSAAIDVSYGTPVDPTETALTEMLRQSELLERLARYMQTQFAFPEPITIRLTHCRAPNAYWDEDYRDVVLCFELMTALLKIADQPEVAAAVGRFRARQ